MLLYQWGSGRIAIIGEDIKYDFKNKKDDPSWDHLFIEQKN
jgi:hypothetical protein